MSRLGKKTVGYEMEISGAKALIKSLECERVDTIFGYPGATVIPIYDELYQQERVRHYLV
jgi:acetolactate synthase-1/2/3 large subunit